MSQLQKERFDFWFKVFVMAAISFIGWIGNRTANQFDSIEQRVQSIQITIGEMQTDIDWLKRETTNRK